MSRIKATALLTLFERMYAEHWRYEWGAAQTGCVDCSGAFVYAFKALGGPAIAHGSNSIFRQSILGYSETPHSGDIAFKVRPWSSDQSGNSWYNTAPGNVYHAGLVDETGKHVLNAKSEAAGFSRDKVSAFQYFARLKAVDYDEEARPVGILYNARVDTQSDPLALRNGPSTSSSKLCSIPRGAIVGIYEELGEWLGVMYGAEVGYAAARYLTREGEAHGAQDGTAAVGRIVIRDAAGREFYPHGAFTVTTESDND